MTTNDGSGADKPLFAWARDPRRQYLSVDRAANTKTFARPCTLSRDYVVARVEFDPATGADRVAELSKADYRFIYENLTPAEAIAHG